MATLALGGFDPTRGAGVTADLEVLRDLGEPEIAIITAMTDQDESGVQGIEPTNPERLHAQIDRALDEHPVQAIKLGMLGDAANAQVILSYMKKFDHLPWILDPVVATSSGGRLMPRDVQELVVRDLLPLCTLITPNLLEIQALFQEEIHTERELVELATRLSKDARPSFLLKGGHLDGLPVDVLGEGGQTQIFRGSKRYQDARGTGCRLATCVAVHLGKGRTMTESIRAGRNYVEGYLSAQETEY
jgi:hydroxymethylpyrimidine/phosphomethylpyrimidine kinase